MVVSICMVLASAGTATATVAGGAAAVAAVRNNKNLLELIGLRSGQPVVEEGAQLQCMIWDGSRWIPCTVALFGDVLLVAGRRAVCDEAFILASAQIAEIDAFVTILLNTKQTLKLRFGQAEEATNFGEQLRAAAALAQEMSQLADRVVRRRQRLFTSRSASTLRSQNSRCSYYHLSSLSQSRRSRTRETGVGCTPRMSTQASTECSPTPSKESSRRTVPSLNLKNLAVAAAAAAAVAANDEDRPPTRRELQLPANVPMFEMSPSPSGCDLHPRDDRSLHQLHQDVSTVSRKPSNSHLLSSFETDPIAETSPRDESSFASQVFLGLGLSAAKAGLDADTRVTALMTRFGQESPTRSR
eukprot:TRINITY_DN8521_c0_g1_i1.p1 TRINITY_DN8521_c0_g1~~TRINITY_DN8521_c0_g1_i1.p1  ORF type:complete len:367 (+),score=66.70 TRINITY_DN8521_c0_g1_i1:31-1101(+)